MKSRRPSRRSSRTWLAPSPASRRRILAALLAGAASTPAFANPQGMGVAQGSATAVASGGRLDITTSHNAVINWSSFNIAPGETTAFHQPSAVSVVWNRILDANPSQIWGSLNANGIVVLMNQNGFYFGPNSSINVGGFIATTAPIAPESPMGGGMWSFQGPPPTASIINYGQVRANNGGSIFLVAEKIENHGILCAPDGTLGLYAGKEVLITDRPDGRGLSARVKLPSGSIDNTGQLIADAGTIALHARVVNQNGLVQANSAREHNGVIELEASEAVNLGANSLLQANGGGDGVSDGGSIRIQSAGSLSDQAGSRLEARGGGQGGNGGAVEICATQLNGFHSRVDGTAQPGWNGGRLLFDPYDLTLSGVDDGVSINVNSAFAGLAQITLQATHDITLAEGTIWDLNGSTGISDAGSLLRLEAGNSIFFGDNARIASSGGWSVQLSAGLDFALSVPAVRNGVGGIYLNGGPGGAGSGAIETVDGSITLNAGREVLLGGGYVRTTGGGNISVTTGDGNVDTGTKNDTYEFNRRGYDISSHGLGGIGTAAGGNVNITAGGDILGFTAPIGAFGSEAGDVSLTAGGTVFGNFMVRSGTGTILGADVGSAASPISLGLVSGGWNVHATRDLYLNEVYNPNGVLNGNRVSYGARIPFLFDYALDAFANLTGGNSVHLMANNLARVANNTDRSAIYAPILSITAGAGGVELGNDLVLYPSAQGRLSIHTTDGGSLYSTPGAFFQLVMSDSGSLDYRTFMLGHAAVPVHQNDTSYGVTFDISGNLESLFLRAPCQNDMTVGGNVVNFSFEGQNLAVGNVSRLAIGDDYFSRSDRTVTTVGSPIALLPTDEQDPLLSHLVTPAGFGIFDPRITVNATLGSRLSYNSETRQLVLQGLMTPADLAFLLQPQVVAWDPITGLRRTDALGNPITVPAVFTTDTAALQRLFAESQDIPTSGLAYKGLQIGGPGRFELTAHNLDLGMSSGIRSVGPLLNAALPLTGADLDITLTGDLNMTSSQIASFNGGNLDVSALGRMSIGSQDQFGSDDVPKGLYTAHGGHVNVHAGGDVSVSGSRIASYDGGDVSVISDTGNVDAGEGAKGFFSVTTSQIDPVTGLLDIRNDRFFGSGIMALTRVDSAARVGNILVKAGQDIVANTGGVLQLAFNQVDQSAATVMLDAGGSIHAGQSGVLGGNVSLKAGGDIDGVVVANQNVVIDASKNVSVTALAGGTASVSAGDKVSGSIVSGGSSSVGGATVDASVISTGGTTSGDTGGGKGNAFSSVAAPVAAKTTESADKTVAKATEEKSDEDELKKKKPVQLAKRVSRVTVILPKK